MTHTSNKIYDFHFWLVCLSALLFFASFNMLIPELPAYLTQLGGADYKGLIISLFTVTAMLSRPFSGKLADKMGRIPVMIFGCSVCLICSLVYPMLTSIYGFFLLRFVHGFSTGFTPTGQAAYLSDVIPAHKRGEAMGYLGTAGALGSASGPAIGGLVALEFGLNTMFYLSSFFALLSIIILINTQETLKDKNRFRPSMLKVSGADIFESRVLAPCLVMVLSAYAYGAVFTLIPDFGAHVGIKNKGLLFTYLTVASLLVRLIAGKASDRYGRVPVLRLSTFLIIISMVIIGLSDTQFMLIVGITLYGFAQGMTSPTLLAWATDLSDEHHKGRGVASLYIFMEMGIGLGAIFSGWLYANDSSNFFFTFIVCSALAFLAFSYLTLKPLLAKV
ncbi:MAG TPA: MFS transporter [Cyclobacteriaceae bacterium]